MEVERMRSATDGVSPMGGALVGTSGGDGDLSQLAPEPEPALDFEPPRFDEEEDQGGLGEGGFANLLLIVNILVLIALFGGICIELTIVYKEHGETAKQHVNNNQASTCQQYNWKQLWAQRYHQLPMTHPRLNSKAAPQRRTHSFCIWTILATLWWLLLRRLAIAVACFLGDSSASMKAVGQAPPW